MLARILIIALLTLTAPLCQARDEVSFKKSNLLLPDGGTQNAELIFVPDQHLIAVRCLYHGGIRIPYDKVVSLTQSLSERKYNPTAIALTGVAGLLFTKSPQHYLYINYEEDGTVRQIGLHLDKGEWQRAVDTAHAETGKTVEVAGPNGPPPPAPLLPSVASPPAVSAPAPTATAPEQASLTITSAPAGADVQANGEFLGSTPSTVKLDAGDYTIVVEKKGYSRWERRLKLAAGTSISLNAPLESSQPVASTPPEKPVAAPPIAPPAVEIAARPSEKPVEPRRPPAEVHPIQPKLGQPIAIPGSGVEIVLSKVAVVVGAYQGMHPYNPKGKPENNGVLVIVFRVVKGTPATLSAMDPWITDEAGQRSAKEDMAGLAKGPELTWLFNVPRKSRRLWLHAGDSLAIDLAGLL